MTEKEAQQQALELMFKSLRLNEFQRIAVSDLMADIEGLEFPPAPDSEHERKLIELGAIISEGQDFFR